MILHRSFAAEFRAVNRVGGIQIFPAGVAAVTLRMRGAGGLRGKVPLSFHR
jgi:hypothetical protein